MARIAVGEHPNQLVLHGSRLFVACASSNTVSVIDTNSGVVTETICTSLFPTAPQGSTPAALAIAPDGKTLYVANADNNCIAVIDVSEKNETQVQGFIPTGWYPTSVAVTPDGKHLLIGTGKGLQSKANPPKLEDIPKEEGRKLPYPYIGTTMSGALSVVPIPSEKELFQYTSAVYRELSLFRQIAHRCPAPGEDGHSHQGRRPQPDQVRHLHHQGKPDLRSGLRRHEGGQRRSEPGDVRREGDAEPSQARGRVRAARQPLLQRPGVARRPSVVDDGLQHRLHRQRLAPDLFSTETASTTTTKAPFPTRPRVICGTPAPAPSLSYRSYGEYGKRISQEDGSSEMEGRVPGLVGHMCPDYGVSKVKGVKMRDTDNVEVFLKEYNQFAKKGTMPSSS